VTSLRSLRVGRTHPARSAHTLGRVTIVGMNGCAESTERALSDLGAGVRLRFAPGHSELFGYARLLVRAGTERARSNPERLREYTDAALPRLRAQLEAKAPVPSDLEQVRLSYSLESGCVSTSDPTMR